MAISEEQLKRLAEQLPDVSRDPQSVRNRVEAMEKVLERAFGHQSSHRRGFHRRPDSGGR